MPYQYVREPLTDAEADRLANACETPTKPLIVWTLLVTGLRVGELCTMISRDILWQQRQLRVRGKGGPYGKFTIPRPCCCA
jgi:integrase/recombinase XerD